MVLLLQIHRELVVISRWKRKKSKMLAMLEKLGG